MSRTSLVTTAGNVDAEKIGSDYRQTVQLGGDGTADLIDPVATDAGASVYRLPVGIVGQVAHDEVDIGSPLKIGGRVHLGVAVDSGDRVDARFTKDGGLVVHEDPLLSNKCQVYNSATVNTTVQRALVDAVAIGTTQVAIAGVASKYIYVTGFVLSVDTAPAKVTFEKTTGGANLFVFHVLASSPLSVFAPPGRYLFMSDLADGINLLASAANNALGMIYYVASDSLLT